MTQQSRDFVKCLCSTCDNELFRRINAWSRISDTYFTFSSEQPEDYAGTGLSGDFPHSAGSSELEGCVVQSLYCNQCSIKIGVKCVHAPPKKIQHKGRSFFRFSKVAFMTVGAGTAVSINIVDSSSNPASFRSTPDAEMQGPNLQSSSDQIVFSTTDGQSDQKDVAKRMEQKLGQALDLINKQREDIDLLLKNVTGLRRGLVSVQESVAQLETINSKYPDTVNLQTELSFMRLQLDAMQAASSEPLQPAPQSRPHQTAKMKGPLARRPLEPATTNRSPTFTATIRESTSSGSSKIQSSGPPASTESRDISMSEDRPPPSANPFEDGQWRTSDQSRHRETLESSPGTFGRADSITVEPQKSSLRNNAVDRLMGPPGPPNSRLGPTESRQQIPSSSEIFPRPTRELSEADTQEYLQRTVATDDAEDTDYEPSNHSASLSSMRPSNVPASVEVQSSLDNILDPVTPSAGEGAYGPAHGGSQDADRSRQSWMDDQRRSSEWYGNAWVDPRELHQNGMTPSRMHNDGSSNMRRGVSRGLGSGRGAKRQKTTRDGKVDGRSVEKQRDAEGYLLRADGTRDMRSARYRDKQSAGEVGGGGADGGGSGGSAAFEEANDTITMYGEDHQRVMGLIFPQRRQQLAAKPRNNVVL